VSDLTDLECFHGEEQDNDFLGEPLALFMVMCDAAPVGDVIEHGPDVLELSLRDSQVTQAAEHLGAVSKVSPEGHLDQQCSILWGELLLLLSLAIIAPLGKSLENATKSEHGSISKLLKK
jgi:hypothetical protein